MSDEVDRPRFREHLGDLGRALGAMGKDVGEDVADAPHLAKQGAKSAMARAAGIKRTPLKQWSEPDEPSPK
jgi:hypothetical protein